MCSHTLYTFICVVLLILIIHHMLRGTPICNTCHRHSVHRPMIVKIEGFTPSKASFNPDDGTESLEDNYFRDSYYHIPSVLVP